MAESVCMLSTARVRQQINEAIIWLRTFLVWHSHMFHVKNYMSWTSREKSVVGATAAVNTRLVSDNYMPLHIKHASAHVWNPYHTKWPFSVAVFTQCASVIPLLADNDNYIIKIHFFHVLPESRCKAFFIQPYHVHTRLIIVNRSLKAFLMAAIARLLWPKYLHCDENTTINIVYDNRFPFLFSALWRRLQWITCDPRVLTGFKLTYRTNDARCHFWSKSCDPCPSSFRLNTSCASFFNRHVDGLIGIPNNILWLSLW